VVIPAYMYVPKLIYPPLSYFIQSSTKNDHIIMFSIVPYAFSSMKSASMFNVSNKEKTQTLVTTVYVSPNNQLLNQLCNIIDIKQHKKCIWNQFRYTYVSRTEAMMHSPQIKTYVVVGKETKHRGALLCSWKKACFRTKERWAVKKSSPKPFVELHLTKGIG